MDSDEYSDEKIAAAREKLRKKFGNIQTGGKGTIRRKKKVEVSHIVHRITDEERAHNKSIDEVNNKILELSDDYYEIWTVYFDDYLFDMCSSMKKKDLKKKAGINLELIRNSYHEFFSDNLINIENGREIFKMCYKYVKSIFTLDGYNYFMNNISILTDAINKKEYLETNTKTEIEDINIHHKRLELDENEIPTKAEIKKAYLIKSTKYHPDKHPSEHDKYSKLFQEIHGSYKLLNEYYYSVKKEVTYDDQ